MKATAERIESTEQQQELSTLMDVFHHDASETDATFENELQQRGTRLLKHFVRGQFTATTLQTELRRFSRAVANHNTATTPEADFTPAKSREPYHTHPANR